MRKTNKQGTEIVAVKNGREYTVREVRGMFRVEFQPVNPKTGNGWQAFQTEAEYPKKLQAYNHILKIK